MWRNWQTRRSQKPVMVTSWRFKSSHPHQNSKGGQRTPTLFIFAFSTGQSLVNALGDIVLGLRIRHIRNDQRLLVKQARIDQRLHPVLSRRRKRNVHKETYIIGKTILRKFERGR